MVLFLYIGAISLCKRTAGRIFFFRVNVLKKHAHISQLFAAIEELSKHGQVFFDMRYTSELKSTRHRSEEKRSVNLKCSNLEAT